MVCSKRGKFPKFIKYSETVQSHLFNVINQLNKSLDICFKVSTACALGVFGTQLGTAIGFVLPPFMVRNHDDIDKIGEDLYRLTWVLAGYMIPVVAAIIICEKIRYCSKNHLLHIFFKLSDFPAKPPLPPSQTQLIERVNKANNEKPAFFKSLKELMTNKPFLIHMVAYGINVAVFSALGTYLNQFTLSYFPVR